LDTLSTREDREAELFYADLIGVPAVRHGLRPRKRSTLDPATEQAANPNASAQPARVCLRDVAITENMALLVTEHAPLPVPLPPSTVNAEATRIANISGAQEDYKSVGCVVPSQVEKRLLIFFAGNNNSVTVEPGPDGRARSRGPRWASAAARTNIASPIEYKFESLALAQTTLRNATPSLTQRELKNPVVLIPEDAQRSSGKYWSVPPPGQYGSSNDGRIDGPGTTRLQNLVMECYQHLRCLAAPSGRKYLPPGMGDAASWVSNIQRVYLSGHSGGGKPLVEAAGADMSLITPSSIMGVGGRAIDLWLFDATYGFGIHNYVNFCKNWQKNNLLVNRADGARFVCIYRAKDRYGDTESEATALRLRLAQELQLDARSLLVLHDSADMNSSSIRTRVIPALLSMPVVFIRTAVGHGAIPTKFIPLLLATAAS
jgi:hypothetical protein